MSRIRSLSAMVLALTLALGGTVLIAEPAGAQAVPTA